MAETQQKVKKPAAQATPLSVLQRFRILIRTAQRHSQWIERQSGVTGAQLWALQELAEVPGLRVGELANRMALHQSTASNMVDRLETAALIRKERTSADQRVVRLYLTDEGLALLARARDGHELDEAGIVQLFAGLSLFGFSIALMFGIIVGTYSSIYVGAPIILLWGVKRGALNEEAKPVKLGMASRPISVA